MLKHSLERGCYKTTAEAVANFNYKNYAMEGMIGALKMGGLLRQSQLFFIKKLNN